MLSRASSFVGPGSFFKGDSMTPSLVLSLDAGNLSSYPGTGSIWYDLTSLNNDAYFNGSIPFSIDGNGSFVFNDPSNLFYFNKTEFTFDTSPTASYGVTFSGNSVISLTYSGPWENQGISVESYNENILLRFQRGVESGNMMCGLSENPLSGMLNYNKPNFGFYLQPGFLSVVEGNNFNIAPSSGTYSDSTIYEIIYDGKTVKYYVDSALYYTSLNVPSNPLYLYTTFAYNVSISFVNIEFGPYAQGLPISDSPYTIETWFKTSNPTQSGVLVGRGDLINYNIFGIVDNKLAIEWSSGNYLFSSTQSFIPENWYHAATTYDGIGRRLYLNGVLVGNDVVLVPNDIISNNLTVGAFITPFVGNISIVKIHTNQLQGSRLLSNFNSLKERFGYVYGSLTFDETQSAYLISTSPDYAFNTNDFTVEAFFKPSLSTRNYGGVVSLRTNSIGYGVSINLQSPNSSTPLIEFSANGIFTTYTASNDKWYHVAISRNSGTSSLFVNGDLLSQISDTYNYENNDLVIGRYYTDFDDYYFNGIISNVRVVNGTGLYTSEFSIPTTPLIATESNTKLLIVSQQTSPTYDISGLEQSVTASNTGWTSSVPEFYVTEGLICYLDNYTGGSTWYDLSGNGHNAALYNGYSYNSANGGVVRFDGVGTINVPTSASRGEVNLDLTSSPYTIMYGTRYLQNTPGYLPSGRALGGRYNNWLLGTWNNKVNQFYNGSLFVIGGNEGDSTDLDWHIYTGTMESANGTFSFWNNDSKLTNATLLGGGPNGIVLGSDYLSESANCDISFVLIYNRVLSDSEVALNFNNFRVKLGL